MTLFVEGAERGTAEVGPHALLMLEDNEAPLPAHLNVHGERRWPTLPLFLVVSNDAREDGLALAERLSMAQGVSWAAPDLYLEHRLAGAFTIPPDDPRYAGQWYLNRIKIEEAWALSVGDPSVTVAVVDNGCDGAHPDLVGNLLPGRDVVDSDDDPAPGATSREGNHGTACAGIIGATGNNGIGIVGICPRCTMRCIRMLPESGHLGPVSADVEAFRVALSFNVAVVSNSWGYVNHIPVPAALATAIREVATKGRSGRGAVVVFAAGNDNRALQSDELYSMPEVITIGATNAFDELASFSNKGAALDAVAPTGTLTTDLSGPAGADPTDYTNLFGGTSAACPVAAGVVGLLISARPDAGRQEIEQWLIGTAQQVLYAQPDSKGHDVEYGYGLLAPADALRRALNLDAGVIGPLDGVLVPETLGASAPVGCGCTGVEPAGLGFFAVLLALVKARRDRLHRTGGATSRQIPS